VNAKPATAQRLSPWKKALFWAVTIFVVAFVLESVGGWYLRVVQGYDGKHLLQYDFDPYKNILPTPNYVDVRGVRHNAQGFRRSEDVARRKPAGTYRIFLMGASTAYGLGSMWPNIERDFPVLQNSQTIDAYLERILRERFPGRRIEVINAAISSDWTHHELIYLNQAILSYEPDMILFLDGFNDFFFWDQDHDQFASYAYTEHSRVIMGPPTVYSLVYMDGWWLFRKSAFFHALLRTARTVKHALTPAPPRAPMDVDATVRGVQSVFSHNALKMVERTALILQHERIPAVFMLQPMLILERDRVQMPPMERRLFQYNVDVTLPNYETFMRRATPLIADLERRTVTDLGATFLDLTGIFEESQGQIFTDYAHLTPRGNEILAQYVADHIAPLMSRDSTPHP
jgi:lysophospholipase L1-like esterase